jgi:peptidoglycan/xylan/chitin deacetylase (PgdA/CDA1 family)
MRDCAGKVGQVQVRAERCPMIPARQALIRLGLEALHFSGAHRLLGGLLGGVGAILTLHHVRPAPNEPFQPNRTLEVTPQFLEEALVALRRQGLELISLDEMHARLGAGSSKRRFVCLTFDDGYRDNREWAYPILRRRKAPFAIYVPTSFPDQRGQLWWETLKTVIASSDHVELVLDEGRRRFACHTTAEKYAALAAIHRALRALPSEELMHATVAKLAARAGHDPFAHCSELCMSWQEIAELAADPLVTIGAHTVHHPRLGRLGAREARNEMVESAARIEAMLGMRPAHFAYPFGDRTAAGSREFAIARDLGFKTAVTTRPGVLFPEHRDHLTALPRISLNGDVQRLRHLDVLISGAATTLWNGFRRVNAA